MWHRFEAKIKLLWVPFVLLAGLIQNPGAGRSCHLVQDYGEAVVWSRIMERLGEKTREESFRFSF